MDVRAHTLDLLTCGTVIEEYPALTLRHLRSLRASGALPGYLIRHRVFFDRNDVEAYLQSCRSVRPQAHYRSR